MAGFSTRFSQSLDSTVQLVTLLVAPRSVTSQRHPLWNWPANRSKFTAGQLFWESGIVTVIPVSLEQFAVTPRDGISETIIFKYD